MHLAALTLLLAAQPAPGQVDIQARVCAETFTECRQLLVDGYHLRAKLCFDQFLQLCPDDERTPVARAMRRVATELGEQSPVREETPPTPRREAPAEEPPRNPVEAEPPDLLDRIEEDEEALQRQQPEPLPGVGVERDHELNRPGAQLFLNGAPELVLISTLAGGQTGYLAVATLLAARRTPSADSTLPLLTTPVLGAAMGLTASVLSAYFLEPDPGTMALASSAMMVGHVHGFLLAQSIGALGAAYDQRTAEVVPLSLGLSLATGLVASAAGAAAAPFLSVDPGDVGLMNSAALWGGVLPLLGMMAFDDLRGGAAMPWMVPLAGSLVAYDLVLGLSPLLNVSRPATWLIELGGGTGAVVGVMLSPFVQLAAGARTGSVDPGVVAVSSAIGVGLGAAGCFLLSDGFAELERDLRGGELPLITLHLEPSPGHPERPPVVGARLAAVF